MVITTPRLILRPWQASDRESFSTIHTTALSMQDYAKTLTRAQSDEKFDRYIKSFELTGYTRWAAEDLSGNLIGYVGPLRSQEDHPLGQHTDIGWRLLPFAWGSGYATEAAAACLHDCFSRHGLPKVFAYTAPDNTRSRNVMHRLGLTRESLLDFNVPDEGRIWHGMVWSSQPSV